MQQLFQKLSTHQYESKILKKGIQIQNQKLSQMESKARNFDQLLGLLERKEAELNQMKMQNHFLLKNQIGEAYNKG